MKPTNNCKFF